MKTAQVNPILILFFKHLHRAFRFLNRLHMRIKNNFYPTSYPLPTGDSFRSLANHIYEKEGDINPEKIQPGDIVFSSNEKTKEFLEKINPHIKSPYILISHNGDLDMDQSIVDLLDEKIVRFYAQDSTFTNPKVVPIPIGIENLRLYTNGIPWALRFFTKKAKQMNPNHKKNKILYRFSIQTNPKHRAPLLEFFKKLNITETFTEMLPPILHLNKLMGYKFVASPRGNSIESCRTWEALYLKTIPMVENFHALTYFKSLGLPMYLTHDWKELEKLTEDDLSQMYFNIMKDADFSALHMDFWINMIQKDQEIARKIQVK